MAFQRLIFLLLEAGGVYLLYKLAKFFYAQWTSPLRALPGPPNPSLIYGNMKLIWEAVSLLYLPLILCG
jgi:hypothetical protein